MKFRKCPKCKEQKGYYLFNNKFKCSSCKFEWDYRDEKKGELK